MKPIVFFRSLIGFAFLIAAAVAFWAGIPSRTEGQGIILFAYVVNSTGDGSDAFPGDENCETATGNGVCTLRAAIQELLRDPTGAKFISFNIPVSDPGCSGGNCTITLGSALPDIAIPISITGPGADKLTVQRNLSYTGPNDPHFHIFNVTTSGTVGISELTINHGAVFSQTDYLGGGIQNYNAGTVNVNNCVVTNNSATQYFDNVGNRGPLALGGGIANRAGGTINITSSTIGAVPITSTTFTNGNSADYGGGIYNSGNGTVNIINSVIGGGFGNSAANGGGIYNDGIVNVTDTTFEDDHAPSGGGIYNNGTLTITGCTFDHNESEQDGGGIYNSAIAGVRVSNSTFYVNFVSGNDGSKDACGGAIFNLNALSVFNSTFTLNYVGGTGSRVGGGAIFNDAGGSATIKSTIFSGNTIETGAQTVVGGTDLYGAFTSGGFNLIGSTDGNSGFTARTDLTGAGFFSFDPKFELDTSNLPNLKDNGGPTDTIALICGSPAIDQGSSTLTFLSGNFDASTTTIIVDDASMIPPGVGFTIQIGNEQMVVNSKSGNTLTITRGANGTTAASHSFKANVRSAFDQRGLGYRRIFNDVLLVNAFDGSEIGAYEVQQACGGPTCNQALFSENLDNVTAPALPSGWSSQDPDVQAQQWTTSSTTSDTAPNNAFINDPAFEIDARLYSPVINVPSPNARLTFRNSYSLYYTGHPYDASDGGVLEISINGGQFQDIIYAGGSFISGGYNNAVVLSPLSNCCNDSNGGRPVWTGNTNGYVTTIVNLPPSAGGQNVQFRWRIGTVNPGVFGKTAGQGWRIDTITLVGCTAPSADLQIMVGDGKSAAVAGEQNTYTIIAKNNGSSYVTGAVVKDTFPSIFSGISYTATESGGASGYTARGTGNINNTVTMPPGSSITYKAVGKLSAAATGTISDSATITQTGITDPNTANNTATDTDTITLKADLKVTVTDGKTSAIPGTKNTYTIVVTNAGPSKVIGAIIHDTFPSTFTGVTYTAAQSGGVTGFTSSGNGNISNTVAMPAGSKITYKATGTISASATGSISDTAMVTTPTGVTDPNTANNSATDTDTL